MNDSVESDIGDAFKKGLISSEESSTIHVFCKQNLSDRAILPIKVTRPSFFGGVPSYFEALWYPHLYFYRKSNTQNG